MQNHAMLAELGIIALLAIPFIVSFATNKRWRKRRRLLEIDRCSDDEARPAPGMREQEAILERFMDRYGLAGLPEGMEWYVRDLDAKNMKITTSSGSRSGNTRRERARATAGERKTS